MKTKLVILSAVVAAFCVGHLCRDLPTVAQADGTPRSSACADTNGDNKVDISDALFLLNWLFLGGAEPNCPLPSAAATGQTTCYDTWGFLVNCDDPGFPGQDGRHRAGCPSSGRFVDNGDGTISDTCTGLMWQNDELPGTLSWEQALQYCDDLEHAEQVDWRLPNIRELQSLVDFGRFAPTMDSAFFTQAAWYWSSTSASGDPSLARHVNFHGGSTWFAQKTEIGYVRAVRGGLD